MTKLFGQPAEHGAWPTLRAATEAVSSGAYFGPANLFGTRGPPVPDKLSKKALDAELGRKLWEASEQLTGVSYDFGVRKAA
jgi:hypothetical protein